MHFLNINFFKVPGSALQITCENCSEYFHYLFRAMQSKLNITSLFLINIYFTPLCVDC